MIKVSESLYMGLTELNWYGMGCRSDGSKWISQGSAPFFE
jgi:hypothetical protein